ncbi:MAG: hypothetical protein KBT20_11245 [Bacteroidales bacterium]|nr:hypothetical protein [Candidatus Liminaster caballi]
MNLTPEMRSFLRLHSDDDPTKLLLAAGRYPDIDVRWAAEQLMARRQIRTKLPEWWAKADDLIMGGRIPAEQCSSEQTARYKQKLVVGSSLCDMTGGMGVDSYYMSRGLEKTIYTERQPHLCDAARHNFAALGADNINVREGDGQSLPIPDVDTIYIDPARRAHDGSRVYDIADCEPNVATWKDQLLEHCHRLIIKLSPMADITRVLEQLPEASEVHVVAVRNECKEVLVVMERKDMNATQSTDGKGATKIHCVDFRSGDEIHFEYTLNEEQEARAKMADAADVTTGEGRSLYLYEPDVTLLKAGAFRLPAERYGLLKIDTNSHLYVSDRLVSDFPGRIFETDETMTLSSKLLKTLKRRVPQANISTRNCTLSADELRKRTGIRDGGSTYIVGTSHPAMGQLLMLCHKCLLMLLILLIGATSASAKRKKKAPEITVESMLNGVTLPSPDEWATGMPFVYLNDRINQTLMPETPDLNADTLCYKNTRWEFEGVVSEEDWMGRQIMSLRFRSPLGRIYRFATGRPMDMLADKDYHPAIPGMVAQDPITAANICMMGKEFYLMINDERVSGTDSTHIDKFVRVTVDSITTGTEHAPLRVWFTHPQGISTSFLSSLPNSRENSTSTAIQKFLSVKDPYLNYPNIKREDWEMICRNQIHQGMTIEEVRLSWGRPQRFERLTSKGGLIERWHYQERRVLEFVDGRLSRIARER